MDKQTESNREVQKNSSIRINKKMRIWNKYKNYMIALAVILVVVALVVFVLKGCGKSGADESKDDTIANQDATNTTVSSNETSQSATGQTDTTIQTTQATTEATGANKVYTTTKVLAKEAFTTSSFFDNSVFLGDSIVSGIEYYGHLGSNKIVAESNLTTDKALSSVDKVVSYAPQKVFIMLGINDLNYGVRSVDTIAANYATLINAIKAKLPSAKIYILSVLPITQAYETKTNVYIRKTNLDALNNKLKGMVTTSGVGYLDLSPLFENSSGYLNESVTGNGINISNDYYGFMLNTIADMLK